MKPTYKDVVFSQSERGLVHILKTWDRHLEVLVWMEEHEIENVDTLVSIFDYNSFLIEDEAILLKFKLTFG